ncbi:MAG: hypothetical protein JST30_12810 [Armatimonadetes bacterium]|nr:hypothetical protein [Armatimonadota bacterium]
MSTWTLGLALLTAAPASDDDRDVVQTAMLSFLKHEPWYASDWKPKDYVVLGTKFRETERVSFTSALDHLRESVDADLKGIREGLATTAHETKADVERLRRELARLERSKKSLDAIKDADTDSGPRYVPQGIAPLAGRSWDKRIKVTDKSNRFLFRRDDKNADPSLEKWTVYGYASPPSYSSNGRYAIVGLGIPWSMHSSLVTFFLQRTAEGWKISATHATFYV